MAARYVVSDPVPLNPPVSERPVRPFPFVTLRDSAGLAPASASVVPDSQPLPTQFE